MNSRIVSAFRIIAVVEAMTWLGLLVGMYFKWIDGSTEVGVKVFGPIHGGVFVLYLAAALITARVQRWSLWTTAFAVAASVPPFFTLWFEIWAKRTGRLYVTPQPSTALPA